MHTTDDETPSPAKISRQAGLLVSLFALSQFATSVPWASFANHFGRKSTIIIGIVLSIISNVGFGFSTSIPAVMFWRILAGLGNGNIGVMRTMTAEIVKERKYQSRAFLLLPLVFNSGVVIGLFLGGCLAQPIINIPSLFGPEGAWNFSKDPEGVAWMRAYPFALPTLFNAGVLMISLFFAVFGLKETMPGMEDNKDWGLVIGDTMLRIFKRIFMKSKSTGYAVLDSDDRAESEVGLLESMPSTPGTLFTQKTSQQETVEIKRAPGPRPKLSIFSKEIYTREVLCTFLSFALLPLHNSAFMQLFPVFLSTPPSSTPSYSAIKFNGGLGLASPTIGVFLSSFGIFGILIQLFIYPSLQAWLGTLRSYRVALAIFPFAYILAPYICLIPSSNFGFQAVAIAFILFLQVTARTFGIPSTVILLTNSAPTPLALGAVHGVGNMLSSLARTVGPLLGGYIFGWGIEHGAIGMVWWSYLTTIAAVGLAWSWMLTEGEHPTMKGKGKPNGREKGSKEEAIELMVPREEGKEVDEKGSRVGR